LKDTCFSNSTFIYEVYRGYLSQIFILTIIDPAMSDDKILSLSFWVQWSNVIIGV